MIHYMIISFESFSMQPLYSSFSWPKIYILLYLPSFSIGLGELHSKCPTFYYLHSSCKIYCFLSKTVSTLYSMSTAEWSSISLRFTILIIIFIFTIELFYPLYLFIYIELFEVMTKDLHSLHLHIIPFTFLFLFLLSLLII